MTLSGETFEAYLTYLYECALHRYGDCPEIDTIVQESMLAFWKTLQSGAEIGKYLLSAPSLKLCIHEPNTERAFDYLYVRL